MNQTHCLESNLKTAYPATRDALIRRTTEHGCPDRIEFATKDGKRITPLSETFQEAAARRDRDAARRRHSL